MNRSVWVPSSIVLLAGLGTVFVGTADRVTPTVPSEAAKTAEFVPPAREARVEVSYRRDGDDPFSDVAVATVEPFDGDGDDAVETIPANSLLPAQAVPKAARSLQRLAAAGDAKAKALKIAEAAGDASADRQPAMLDKPVEPARSAWQSAYFADNPLVGQVFGADGTPSSQDALLGAAHGARYVLLGEIHDNPDHHLIQSDIIGGLAKLGAKPSVVFEMIPQGFADILAGFEAGDDKDLATLAERLQWSERGWPDFSLYRPIFDSAVANDLPIRAGNLDRETVRAIAEDGVTALTDANVRRWSLDDQMPAAQSAELAETIREAHCGLMPDGAIAPMTLVQRARDGALAEAMIGAAGETGSAVLIAGSGHVRNDWAVPVILAEREPQSRAVSVQMVEVAEGEGQPADYGLTPAAPAPFDFTIFTPRQNVSDRCAELRAQMGASVD
ncbi:ChaN family lipoprotein [Aurantimonas sp. A3-2-R12]|uniref:ChaN family lipoprotein n=1 Tax=Aurantimonas sp. A3-2-R12 TaxID=3114362 RepID=UPI002E18CE07|nr:ChaN family lipoprotein [Aurantimonas sp. A3-2-R12]